jgi:hypothetical protein
MRVFVLIAAVAAAVAACNTDVIDHSLADNEPGISDSGGDAGPCAACDPPRNGLFCGYAPGCESPVLACWGDGSGDPIVGYFCGCDGMTFIADRFGSEAADRPNMYRGECHDDAGS